MRGALRHCPTSPKEVPRSSRGMMHDQLFTWWYTTPTYIVSDRGEFAWEAFICQFGFQSAKLKEVFRI
jgi:hypothetical protein